MVQAESNKQKAFKLFDQGKSPTDPEVKALKLTHPTRWQYYKEWKRQSSEESEEAKEKPSEKREKPPGDSSQREQAGKADRESRQGQQTEKQTETKQTEAGREWRCLACGFSSSPDGKGYSQAMIHPCAAKKRKLVLVDRATGEILATNIMQAQLKGFIPRKREQAGKADRESRQGQAEPRSRQTGRAKELETMLPEGESMGGIAETDEVPSEKERTEGVSQDFVEGAAIWIKAKVNVKTMTYYQLAANQVRKESDGQLPLGDFLDIVTEDYFKARGLTLHLG